MSLEVQNKVQLELARLQVWNETQSDCVFKTGRGGGGEVSAIFIQDSSLGRSRDLGGGRAVLLVEELR